jgi:hypothetical protein
VDDAAGVSPASSSAARRFFGPMVRAVMLDGKGVVFLVFFFSLSLSFAFKDAPMGANFSEGWCNGVTVYTKGTRKVRCTMDGVHVVPCTNA